MSVIESTVYTFDMPKFVYVQVRGVTQPAKIRADKAEFIGPQTNPDKLMVKLGNDTVGQFDAHSVQGWWIEDEPEKGT